MASSGIDNYTDGDDVRSDNTQLSVKSEAQLIGYAVGRSLHFVNKSLEHFR